MCYNAFRRTLLETVFLLAKKQLLTGNKEE